MAGGGVSERRRVGVLGTGQFASALTARLLDTGYSVTMGSRRPGNAPFFLRNPDPHRDEAALGQLKVTSLQDCVTGNDVIVVALHVDHYAAIFTSGLAGVCSGRVLVDVSNDPGAGRGSGRRGKNPGGSAAETLAALVPGARVVKAFNSVSAYVMENDVTAGGTRRVAVAGDDVTARAAVCALARDLGFLPAEVGGLMRARDMEHAQRAVFPRWRPVAMVTALLTSFWLLFALARFYLADNRLRWDQLPLKVGNKVFGATALTLLGLTYLPGTCAAVVRSRPLPRWLMGWLRARRQLGLAAFALTSLHALTSALTLSPAYEPAWFPRQQTATVRAVWANQTGGVYTLEGGTAWMTWVGELALLLGCLAFGLMALLAVTSLPSVSNSLSLGEWQAVHSGLGHVMLTVAVAHVTVMGVPKWVSTGFPELLLRVKWLSVVLPTFTLLARLALLCLGPALARRTRDPGSDVTATAC